MSDNVFESIERAGGRQDPREALGPLERMQVITLIRSGCSRRMAAREVGCSTTTIARCAMRHPDFFSALVKAESGTDVEALRRVRDAMNDPKYWRAAAWILERRNPEEYGRGARMPADNKSPNAFSRDEVLQIVSRIFRVLVPAIAADKLEAAMDDFNAALAVVEEETDLPLRGRNLYKTCEFKRYGETYIPPIGHPEWDFATYKPTQIQASKNAVVIDGGGAKELRTILKEVDALQKELMKTPLRDKQPREDQSQLDAVRWMSPKMMLEDIARRQADGRLPSIKAGKRLPAEGSDSREELEEWKPSEPAAEPGETSSTGGEDERCATPSNSRA